MPDFNSLIQIASPGLTNSTVGGIVGALVPYIFGVAGFLLLIFAVLAGYQILTSTGDPKALQQAKGKLTHAVAGFIIVFCSYWLVQLLARILNLQKIIELFP